MAQLQKQIDLLEVGQTVIVETNEELLKGVLKHVEKKWSIIELGKVCDMRTNYVYSSNQMINCNQLISIKVLTSDNCDNDGSEKGGSDNDDSEICIELNSVQLDLIQKKLNAKTYITQTDEKYHKALHDIKMQSVVSLCMEPIHQGRTSIIAIATTTNVYIFDMFSLGEIFHELRQIFKSQQPRKVVHVGHKYLNNICHHHKIEMKGIFDTFDAYCLITGNKEAKSFVETVQETLRIPVDFQVADISPLTFNCRPLARETLLHIAKKAILQLELYEYLLHGKMLRRFYKQCEKFSRTIVEIEDDFDAAQELHPRRHSGYNHIQMDGNWKDILHLNP